MKKILLVLLTALILSGCGNKQLIDITYRFDYAEIVMPDGRIVEGEVDSWRDFGDGDQIQVIIDGVTYLTHASNVVLYTRR